MVTFSWHTDRTFLLYIDFMFDKRLLLIYKPSDPYKTPFKPFFLPAEDHLANHFQVREVEYLWCPVLRLLLLQLHLFLFRPFFGLGHKRLLLFHTRVAHFAGLPRNLILIKYRLSRNSDMAWIGFFQGPHRTILGHPKQRLDWSAQHLPCQNSYKPSKFCQHRETEICFHSFTVSYESPLGSWLKL